MKKLFLMLFAFLPGLVSADNVPEEKAKTIAERFFSSSRVMTSGQNEAATSLRMIWDGESMTTRSASAPAFYVFNNEGGKGFVIVSGDDCTASPILGYSFDQNFDAEEMPENLRTWMNGIRSDINRGREMNAMPSNEAVENWARFEYNDKQPIKLLETALWDQRDPYNSKLPIGYVTGCPATAIAIIMRYHKWPEKGVGTIPESNDKIGAVELGHVYDWDNMPLNYNGATKEQKEQVGILMRDVGAMIRTQYGKGSAGAKPEETLPQLMPIYMRYNKATIKSLFKRDFSESEWNGMMQKELDENRPILYGGYSSGGGHQFILDGYAEGNYYHVNWGWSGVSNGYYLLSGMNPPEQGAGGSSSADGFTMNQDAIIGIQPDPENPGGGFYDLMAYKPFYKQNPYGIMTSETEFAEGKTFQVELKEYQNKGSRDFRGSIAIAHYGANGSLKEIISQKKVNYTDYPIAINEFTEVNLKCVISETIEPGDFICGVFKYMNPEDWTPIHNGYTERDNCTEKIVIMEGSAEPVTFDLAINVGKGGKVVCEGQEITSSATIKAEADKQVKMTIVPEKGFQTYSVLFNGDEVISDVMNGEYTTPAISANATMSVTFEDVTGISSTDAEGIRVYAADGMIVAEGMENGETIEVYAIDGAKVKSVKASAAAVKIAVKAGETYIVRVADNNFKVVL